jgi:hypothetical protein
MLEGTRILHTYVVDHGTHPPRVGLKTPVLGGSIVVVAGGDLVQRLERAESLLDQASEFLMDSALGMNIRAFLSRSHGEEIQDEGRA